MESSQLHISFLLILSSFIVATSASSLSQSFTIPIYSFDHPVVQSYYLDLFGQEYLNAVIPVVKKNKYKFKFLARFQVGDPPVSVFAVIDTGSTQNWIIVTAFDYASSKTFSMLTCTDSRCRNYIVGPGCSLEGWCTYSAVYVGKHASHGYAGMETFTFPEEAISISPIGRKVRMILGIDGSNFAQQQPQRRAVAFDDFDDPDDDPNDERYPGLLAVSYQGGGLLKALDVDKFSVCFPMDTTINSYMEFGNRALFSGSYSRLSLFNLHYYFYIKAVSVGDRLLELPSASSKQTGTGFVFDTGAAVTNLVPALMDRVINGFRELIPIEDNYVETDNYDLCYLASDMDNTTIISRSMRRNLQLRLQFEEGNWLNLGFIRTWELVGYSEGSLYYCLVFRKSPKNENIFGAWQMRGINFGLDLHAKRFYHEMNFGCERLN